MPHNKFPDQRELLEFNNSVPSGQKVQSVEMDSADTGDSNNLLSQLSLYCTVHKNCIVCS